MRTPKKQNAIIFISRKERKGRRISNANYAVTGVVADYARQITQRKTETENHPPPPRFALPSVAMGIATLRGHRMTFSHSSKDPLRPPVSEGQLVSAGFSVVTDSPPETGASTPKEGGGG